MYQRAGKHLQAVFMPGLLAWMRDGGMSKDDAYRSYRKSRDAQLKNGVFGKTTGWSDYLLYVLRVFITQRIRKL